MTITRRSFIAGAAAVILTVIAKPALGQTAPRPCTARSPWLPNRAWPGPRYPWSGPWIPSKPWPVDRA